ncbi:MAG: sulfatase-like hydrolase/transferase [Phycisphaerae bacterium]
MPKPRQVIFIMTDTQRTDMLGCYGNPAMKTPALDGLAQRGVRFDNAYTCQPVCGPARAAIFTGTWPHSNGSWANNMAIGDNIKTLGQRLRDNGVHCGYIGKWHLDGSDYFGLGRCADGWDPDYWYDMRRYIDELSPEDRRRSRLTPSQGSPVDAEFTYAHRCSDRAVRFLRNHAGEDFFLVVSYDEPHHPFLCPPRYSEMYRDYAWPRTRNHFDTLENKPAHQVAWAKSLPPGDPANRQIDVADYLGCNSFVDHEIGRVLDVAAELTPEAMVIYTSDHGDGLYSHGITNKGPVAYDEIARIPFLVSWPGAAPAGVISHAPTSHIDIAPTVMDAFGLPLPKSLEGRSMLTTIRDPAKPINDAIFIEYGRYEVDHDGFGGFQPMRAIYDGRHKLVVNLLSSDELYDLQADPQEMVNLIHSPEHARQRDQLHDRLLEWMNTTRDPFRGYYWHRRPWRKDAPAASWHYTGMTRQRENEEYEPRQLDYDTGEPMISAVRRKTPPGDSDQA